MQYSCRCHRHVCSWSWWQVVILFTAHSLPMKVVAKGDTYVGEVAATTRAVMDSLPPGLHNTSVLAWQSKVGFLPWMAPSTSNVIHGLGKQGHKYGCLRFLAACLRHTRCRCSSDSSLRCCSCFFLLALVLLLLFILFLCLCLVLLTVLSSFSFSSSIDCLRCPLYRYVMAVPIAFTSDHIETLYEIDIEYAKEAHEAGITVRRRCSSGLTACSPML